VETFIESKNSIDLYILDINVPGLSGLDLLEYIRTISPTVPIIMISADLSIDTIENAYILGCNDYLKKPFHIKELDLKIQQIAHQDRVIHLNKIISYDTYSKILLKNAFAIQLTKKEMKIMELLIDNRGNLVTFEMIEEKFWNEGILTSDALRSLIKRLRHKMGDSNLIETVNGFGYRLK